MVGGAVGGVVAAILLLLVVGVSALVVLVMKRRKKSYVERDISNLVLSNATYATNNLTQSDTTSNNVALSNAIYEGTVTLEAAWKLNEYHLT